MIHVVLKGVDKKPPAGVVFFVPFSMSKKGMLQKKTKRESEQNDIYPVHQLYIVYIHLSKKNPTHCFTIFLFLGKGVPTPSPVEAVVELDRLVATCGAVAARKRAAVARAKAAIETADAEERNSAVGLLQARRGEGVKNSYKN